jgi:pyridoxal phosphate enzyme (YggS family)
MNQTRNRFVHINHRIKQAFTQSHRPLSHEVTLLAVSKHHTWQKIIELYQLQQRNFGESYLQEALEKIQQANQTAMYSDIVWHFIGPIQSNKTKEIAQNFHWVHSVDRIKIARRLSHQYNGDSSLNICLQININEESQKSGFSQTAILEVMEEIMSLPNLTIRGLMAIPKVSDDLSQQYANFHQLKLLKKQLNQQFNINMDTLSMGMSNDLEAAINEGATIVRIGTALFGAREY